ncbi:MAG TPA: hypothetical protein PLL75_02225 [Candidatus Omnitrophota bacterium]|nr:hypothetical protein [Candidatus Omnitrophota bacterium]HPS36528.1 hypothetical protein [Candidatus Omnitrophota bacterium]
MTTMILGNAQTAEAFFGFGKKKEKPLQQAQKYYEAHEYYNARRFTQEALEKDPNNPEAAKLMADILDKEIERQKEHLLPQAVEEMGKDERRDEIKSWLERSRSLFAMKQYDLALFAAEKVFLYDAGNNDASELIDQIKGQALKEGKAETLFVSKMYEEEISDRLEQYRDQADRFASQGQFGQAKFTAEKVLLLEPEDPRAMTTLKKIMTQGQKKGASL